MKIAVPVAGGVLSMHFGHCESFALVGVDEEKKQILDTEFLKPPAHEPGALPKWLNEQGASVIIAGGMGRRAQQFFQQFGISVIVGAAGGEPAELAQAYLDGSLETGDNICDH